MTQKERFKVVPSVYALFIKDGKILLLKRFQTGFEDGNYGLVAGHADGTETMKEAMVREASEEAGVKINEEDLEFALVMHRLRREDERADFFFVVKNWDGEIKNMEPEKCDDLSWFELNKLPENTILYIRKAIECYLSGEKYCEFGWEKK